MKLEVLSYDAQQNVHKCRVDDGDTMFLDIMVDGGFKGHTPESVVGKRFTCAYLHPYIQIAHDVFPYVDPSPKVEERP